MCFHTATAPTSYVWGKENGPLIGSMNSEQFIAEETQWRHGHQMHRTRCRFATPELKQIPKATPFEHGEIPGEFKSKVLFVCANGMQSVQRLTQSQSFDWGTIKSGVMLHQTIAHSSKFLQSANSFYNPFQPVMYFPACHVVELFAATFCVFVVIL